jgi:hypothetical protein
MTPRQIPGLPNDAVGQIAVEQEVLTKRVPGGQTMPGDNVA